MRRGGGGGTRSSSSELLVPLADSQEKAPYRNPLSSNNNNKKRNSNNNVNVVYFCLLFAVTLTFGFGLFRKEEDHVVELASDLSADEKIIQTLNLQMAQLENEKKALSSQLDLAKTQTRQLEHAQQGGDKDVLNKLYKMAAARIKLHDQIQEFCLARLLHKFGPGPHRVQVQLAFAPESNVAKVPGDGDGSAASQFVIELAPEGLMPHVTYWFLERVTRGLYNGASFHRNAPHVVQAGPAPNFLTRPSEVNLATQFKESGFGSLLFQEYSPQYPHEKYTLGIAGRPGRADFYVSVMYVRVHRCVMRGSGCFCFNTLLMHYSRCDSHSLLFLTIVRNNTLAHGPGGQSSYDNPAEADPCFGKVVEGFAAVDRMHKSNVKPGGYKRMEHMVAITSMKILDSPKLEQVVEDLERPADDKEGKTDDVAEESKELPEEFDENEDDEQTSEEEEVEDVEAVRIPDA
jgi:cyclophilin family peptidyl-prolyl cis-trans isomerase